MKVVLDSEKFFLDWLFSTKVQYKLSLWAVLVLWINTELNVSKECLNY